MKLQEADEKYQQNQKYKSVNNDQKRHKIACNAVKDIFRNCW